MNMVKLCDAAGIYTKLILFIRFSWLPVQVVPLSA